MRARFLVALMAAMLWSGSARAADDYKWSVITATTDAPKSNVFSMELGYPGFTFGWEHGLSEGVDFGLKLHLNYGVFDTPQWLAFAPAISAPFRFVVFHQDMVSVLVRVEPGLFAITNSPTGFGFELTPGAVVAFQILPRFRVAVALDVPLAINVANGTVFSVTPEIGGGFEFFVNKSMLVGLNLRLGPNVLSYPAYTYVGGTFLGNFASTGTVYVSVVSQVVLAFRF